MRFPVQIVVIIVVGFFMELFLPWWSVAIAAFIGGLLVNTRMNFLAGFLGIGLLWIQEWASVPVTPAVGWPAYVVLLILYFAANYMLLGSVFLGIGGQATNVREVQTL